MIKITNTFTATWTNSIGGEVITKERTFTEGEEYTVQQTRPEGITVDGFFLFNRHLVNAELT